MRSTPAFSTPAFSAPPSWNHDVGPTVCYHHALSYHTVCRVAATSSETESLPLTMTTKRLCAPVGWLECPVSWSADRMTSLVGPHQRYQAIKKWVKNLPMLAITVNNLSGNHAVLYGNKTIWLQIFGLGRYWPADDQIRPTIIEIALSSGDVQIKQEAQLMLTRGSTRLAVSRGQQTWYCFGSIATFR